MKWLICVDPYTDKSNGIKHLHEMCDQLNKINEEAYIAFLAPMVDPRDRKVIIKNDPSLLNKNLNTPILPKELLKNNWTNEFIVILPEVVVGNPLNAKNIVRWIGNKQSICSWGQFLSIENDAFILSFSRIFADKPHHVLYKSHIDEFFFESDNKTDYKDRKLDLIYHGKGVQYLNCNIFDNTFFIDRFWPKSRHQLALLLKQCRYFYTYDVMSNINAEALAAGAVPIFVNYSPWTEKEIDSIEGGIFPRGKVLSIQDNLIFGDVDDILFKKQRSEYLNNVRILESNWNERFIKAIEEIKHFFNRRIK